MKDTVPLITDSPASHSSQPCMWSGFLIFLRSIFNAVVILLGKRNFCALSGAVWQYAPCRDSKGSAKATLLRLDL